MGASLKPSGGSRHRGRRRSTAQVAEINVTPMVDVMLVLLIIFMVAAPLLTVGVEVDLPETKAGAIKGEDEPLAVSINKNGQIFVQETEVQLDGLAPFLLEISKNNQDLRIFVRGDAGINYGSVMNVMGVLTSAGFSKVALIAQNPEQSAKGK